MEIMSGDDRKAGLGRLVELAEVAFVTLEANLKAAAMSVPTPQSRAPGTESPLCVYYLMGAICLVTDAEKSVENPSKRKHWRQRGDQARTWTIRWATAPRFHTQMRSTLDQECWCAGTNEAGQMRLSAIHWNGWKWIRYWQNNHPGWFKTPGVQLLMRALDPLESQNDDASLYVSGERLFKWSQRDIWPISLDDLLPNGSLTTLQSLTRWLTVPDIDSDMRNGVLTCIDVVISVAHPVIVPLAIWSSDLHRVIITSVTVAANMLQPNAMMPTVDYGHPIRCVYYTAAIMQWLMMHRMSAALRSFTRFGAHDLMQCCAQALSVAAEAKRIATRDKHLSTRKFWEECSLITQSYTDLACEILTLEPMVTLRGIDKSVESQAAYLDLESQCSERLQLSEDVKSCHHLRRIQNYLLLDEQCKLPGCRRNTADLGRELPACGRCRRIQYCSRRCQKQAWSYPGAPHRDVCKAMHFLFDDLEIPKVRMRWHWRSRLDVYSLTDNPMTSSALVKHRDMLRYVVSALEELAFQDNMT